MNRIFLAPSFALSFVLGCGDNTEPQRCTPTVAYPELPLTGRLIDPYAYPLEGCVDNGLASLPGRWFVSDQTNIFGFHYPNYEGTCDAGFVASRESTDRFALDNIFDSTVEKHIWTNGTLRFSRQALTFATSDFVMVHAEIICMGVNDTLIGKEITYSSDTGESSSDVTGTRFNNKDAPALGLRLLGEANDNPTDAVPVAGFNVAVLDSIAYVAGPRGLSMFDIANPATPLVIGHYPGSFNDVRVVKQGAMIAAIVAPLASNETKIINVSAPTAPRFLSTITEFSHSVQVVSTGAATRLYFANYTNEVPVYDITNIAAPVRLGAVKISSLADGGVHDLTVAGDMLLVNNTRAGFFAVDVSAGLAAPVDKGQIRTSYSHASAVGTTSTGRSVILHGDEGMSPPDGGAFLRILEGDPASSNYMKEIGRYQSRREVGVHNIEMHGDLVYMSYYQDGIRVVDIATPEAPREVAHFNTWDPATSDGGQFTGALGLRKVGNKIYVADSERGLIILEQTPP